MNKEYKGIIAIILNDKGEVLMGKKIIKPGHFLSDSWHLPGGKLNDNEEPEIALKREMLEELGVEVKVEYHLCDYPVKVNDQVFLSKCLVCKMVNESDVLKPADDLQDAKFFPLDELKDIHNPQIMVNWPKELKSFFGID